MLTLLRVDNYVPPNWPKGPQRQQLHLDIAVEELDTAAESAIALVPSQQRTSLLPDSGVYCWTPRVIQPALRSSAPNPAVDCTEPGRLLSEDGERYGAEMTASIARLSTPAEVPMPLAEMLAT